MLLFLGNGLFVRAQNGDLAQNHSFTPGESLTYSIKYGIFKVGRAEVYLDRELWEIEGRPHYYLQFRMENSGFISLFTTLDLCMESWIDSSTLKPKKSARHFFYGSKMDVRTDRFDYADSITVSTYVEDVDRHHSAKLKEQDTLIFDALSSYLYLRNKLPELEETESTHIQIYFTYDLYTQGIQFTEMVDEDLGRYDIRFAESDQFKKGGTSYILGSQTGEFVPQKLVIDLSLGKLVFELVDRKFPPY